jgi:hypothetical protein
MVWANEPIEIDRPKLQLAAIGDLQSRNPCYLLQFGWLSGCEREERVVHALNRSCDDPAWGSLGAKDSQALGLGVEV